MNGRDTEHLIRLSAALARRDPQVLRDALKTCAEGGDARRTEEVILQSYLFLGYPLALNAFAVWREVSGREAGSGIPDSWDDWEARGREVCRTVYEGQYERLRRNVRALHPDMERWMVVEGYGKVLGRPGLELVLRELCIVGLLAVLGTPRQLHSHLRGAMNAGATEEDVERALTVAAGLMSEEERSTAQQVWERVRIGSRRGRKLEGREKRAELSEHARRTQGET